MKCDYCKKDRKHVYQDGNGSYGCVLCLPPSAFDGYPIWKEMLPELKKQENVRAQRAKQAQINFRSK